MKVSKVVARAHAKINLDLRVLGTRPDGFHELRTVFQSLELHDVLVFRRRRGDFQIRCRVPGVPCDNSNVIWRAATTLWKALGYAGEPRDTSVTLEKRIPLQAGLGGGSANAAAALVGFARLWAGGVPTPILRDLAASLGADVPFFLWGGTALGLGRGDEIYPLVDLPRHYVTLVLPPFGVSTPEAYGWYDEEHAAGYPDAGDAARDMQVLPVPWPSRAAQMVNDLEPPVVRRHPDIGQVKLALRQWGAIGAAMSGSGSAIFGLFRSPGAARRAAAELRRPGWRFIVTRTLDRATYERRSRAKATRAVS